jgi:uncharacterized protein
VKVVKRLADIPENTWDALAKMAGNSSLLRHAFLSAFEQTGCFDPSSGWSAEHLTWWEGEALVAALPLYRKTNSYGEFVFDWAWARAFHEAGGNYYPKLISALPFTPCPGSRLLARDDAIRTPAMRDAIEYAQSAGVSSLHVLFCGASEADLWHAHGAEIRTGVQFHWENAGITSFEEYLAGMTHDKRKRIKQERRKVRDAGVTFRAVSGHDISIEDWTHFYRCYQTTYAMRGSTAYLTFDFFKQYAASAPEAQLLIIGERHGSPLCAALHWLDGKHAYGRYWGTLEYIPGLHFETCYYQALEWGIANGIQRIEGGAQGEHKLARGFLPVQTYSAHWIAHDGLRDAVHRFLSRERAAVAHAIDELDASSPFKSPA